MRKLTTPDKYLLLVASGYKILLHMLTKKRFLGHTQRYILCFSVSLFLSFLSFDGFKLLMALPANCTSGQLTCIQNTVKKDPPRQPPLDERQNTRKQTRKKHDKKHKAHQRMLTNSIHYLQNWQILEEGSVLSNLIFYSNSATPLWRIFNIT